MQKMRLWVVLLLGLAVSPVLAQITVEVRLDQEQYLAGETLVAIVRVTNRSGQTLRLGAEPDWLTFSAESEVTGVVPKYSEPPVQGEFILESSKVATKRVDIAPYFILDRAGRYNLLATVKIAEWGVERTSLPVSFHIIEGAKLWQQDFGVPTGHSGPDSPPEMRRYILQQANYIRGQLRLYVRVTDSYGLKTFRVTPVGRVLSFSRPEAQVDAYSNLHLIYQNGPRMFSYTKYNPDGEMLLRQTYEYVDSRPRLFVDADSEIGVRGGARHPLPTDIPRPTLAESSSAPVSNSLARTNIAQ